MKRKLLTTAAVLALSTAAFAASYIGDSGDNYLNGSSSADFMSGKGGDDNIQGREGNDEMWGGDGDDQMWGHEGNDTMGGGNGADSIGGSAGADEIYGSFGNDSLLGQNDNDTIFGGDNDDFIDGGSGSDVLYGGSGSDDMWGGNGSDTLSGGSGNDTMTGIGDFYVPGCGNSDFIKGTGSIGIRASDGSGCRTYFLQSSPAANVWSPDLTVVSKSYGRSYNSFCIDFNVPDGGNMTQYPRYYMKVLFNNTTVIQFDCWTSPATGATVTVNTDDEAIWPAWD